MMVGDLIIRSRIRTMFRSWPDIIAQAMWASAMIRAGRGPLADPPGGLHWAGAALPRADLMLSVL
jgi:hypothetical protein